MKDVKAVATVGACYRLLNEDELFFSEKRISLTALNVTFIARAIKIW